MLGGKCSGARRDGTHRLPQLDERDVVEGERAADARRRLGVTRPGDAHSLAAALASDESGGFESAQRLAHGRAMHRELLGEFGFGRQRIAGPQAAA